MRTPDPSALGLTELAVMAALADAVKLLVTAAMAPQAGQAPGPARYGSLHAVILAADIVGFNAPGRDDEVQLALRRALFGLLTEAFEAAGVAWDDCVHEDRGDGALMTVPAGVPAALVLGPLLTHLGAGLRRYNRLASQVAKIRLRVAAHAGEVHRDEHGLAGRAVTHVFRLVEAPVFKSLVAEEPGDLAVIVSDPLYDTVVRHGSGLIDPAGYRPVIAVLKETRTTAWAGFQGADQATHSTSGDDRSDLMGA